MTVRGPILVSEMKWCGTGASLYPNFHDIREMHSSRMKEKEGEHEENEFSLASISSFGGY